MGTPEFAVPSLRSLATSTHKIIAVVTQPDKPKGRSKIPCPSPVKEAALELGLEIMQSVNINEEAFAKELQLLSPRIIAQLIGAAPRNLGNKEAWMLIHRYPGRLIIGLDKN